MKYNAQLFSNDIGMTPIKAAAERTQKQVVEYFMERPEVSREHKIEALELLGASYANDKDNYSLENAYEYLHRTMKMRYLSRNISISFYYVQNYIQYLNVCT